MVEVPVGVEPPVKKTDVAEASPVVKKKRKIHFRADTFKRKREKAVPSLDTSVISFLTPRELHKTRGYEQYGLKSTQEKPDMREVALAEAVQEEYALEKPKHAKAENTFRQKIKERAEDFQWTVGKITRGDIRKRLRQMESDPFAHTDELQAELHRSLEEMTQKSTSELFDERTKLQAGVTVVASVLPPVPIDVIPIGPVPIPIVYSLGTLAVTAADNIPNTWRAFREKRYRKASAYAVMTALGLATGFIPMSHHLTNTLYAEVLQKPFDHAETHGMLQVISSLLDSDARPNRKALGQQMVATALVDYYTKNGNLVSLEDQLLTIQQYESEKKVSLIAKRDKLLQERDNLPERKKFWDRVKLLGNFKEISQRIGIATEHFRLGQELITIEHKLNTIPQLVQIVRAGLSEMPSTQKIA